MKRLEMYRNTWRMGQNSVFPSIKQRNQHCVDTAFLYLLERQIMARARNQNTRHFCLSLERLTDFEEKLCATVWIDGMFYSSDSPNLPSIWY